MANRPSKMNVLLIGGGGREHALAWKLKQSASLGTLYATHTGNPGIAELAKPIGFEFSMGEVYRLQQFCGHNDIQLVVVGPEGPLAEGIADKLSSEKVAVFGPSREGAQLEADKAWAKEVMRGASIPTAEARVFRDPAAAKSYLESRTEPVVIKASGLAAGKGVVLPSSLEEAKATIDRIMVAKEFGAAGDQVVIEEKLKGPEASVFALIDGRNIAILDTCQDYKRVGDGDTGPNTGGMGAYCPSRVVDERTMMIVEREVLVPIVDALRRDGIEYRGVLYVGLMMTPAGPKVLEFNCRFGDPECQVLMRRMECDLVQVLHAAATGRLHEVELGSGSEAAVCVVLASGGYPGEFAKGHVITGIENANAMPDVTVFHAGTARDREGKVVTAGGRVLNVVATGANVDDARQKALAAVEKIHFDQMHYRRDIAVLTETPRKRVGAR